MFTDFSVEEIVNSYEGLSNQQKQKIVEIAKRRIEDFGITSFDRQYQYVADLVEKWQSPWQESLSMSLDAPIKDGENNSFSQIIGETDPQFEDLFQEMTEEEPLDMGQVLSIFEKELDVEDINFLQSSWERIKNMSFSSSEEENLTSVFKVQQRIKQLKEKYNKNGKLIVPIRPIKEINFEDQQNIIVFGFRSWRDTDPLDFFRKHKDVYGGMTRSELWKFDSGLFAALHKVNKIAEAIPEVSPVAVHLSPKQIEKIAEGRYLNMTLEEIAKYANTSASSAKRHLIKMGLEATGDNKKFSQEAIAEIVKAHNLYGGSASETARRLECSPNSVLRYWKKAGLKAIGKSGGDPIKGKKVNGEIKGLSVIQLLELLEARTKTIKSRLQELAQTLANVLLATEMPDKTIEMAYLAFCQKFGLFGEEPLELKDISWSLGITESQVLSLVEMVLGLIKVESSETEESVKKLAEEGRSIEKSLQIGWEVFTPFSLIIFQAKLFEQKEKEAA